MKRLRALAAILSCLAILASGFMNVAEAAPTGLSTLQQAASGEQPCSHCDDCSGVPCPAPMATCLQATNVAPALATATVDLPAMSFDNIRWSLRSTSLSGLSPPPDPFPPRA